MNSICKFVKLQIEYACENVQIEFVNLQIEFVNLQIQFVNSEIYKLNVLNFGNLQIEFLNLQIELVNQFWNYSEKVDQLVSRLGARLSEVQGHRFNSRPRRK